jgi:RimJ/RimL family protein N-acetyltransferase
VWLAEVIAEIDPANGASIAVAERIGPRRRGPGAGAERDWVRYALTRADGAASLLPG